MKTEILSLVLGFTIALTVTACADNDGPAENLGERIDEAAEDARDRFEDVADEAREAADEIRDELRDN